MSRSVPRCGFPRRLMHSSSTPFLDEILHCGPSIGRARHVAASLDLKRPCSVGPMGPIWAHEPDGLIQHVRIPSRVRSDQLKYIGVGRTTA